MLDWIQNYSTVAWWLGTISALVFLGFLVGVPIIIVKLPVEYFMRRAAGRHEGKEPSVPRFVYLVSRNILGGMLVLAGIAMLFLPGQGILAMIIGVSLLSFRGKRRLVLKIVRQKHVLHSLNRLRAKFGKPAFRIP